MNVVVRPQFYFDLEDEVFWLLTNAGADVAQRWHERCGRRSGCCRCTRNWVASVKTSRNREFARGG